MIAFLPLVRIAVLPLLAASRLLCELGFSEWRSYKVFCDQAVFRFTVLTNRAPKGRDFPTPYPTVQWTVGYPGFAGAGLSSPAVSKKKRTSKWMSFSFWWARRDLNPHVRSEH